MAAANPVGVWNLTADGDTVCPIAGCSHLEPANSGVLARQVDHEREAHGLVAEAVE